jgi:hypothetical protein
MEIFNVGGSELTGGGGNISSGLYNFENSDFAARDLDQEK